MLPHEVSLCAAGDLSSAFTRICLSEILLNMRQVSFIETAGKTVVIKDIIKRVIIERKEMCLQLPVSLSMIRVDRWIYLWENPKIYCSRKWTELLIQLGVGFEKTFDLVIYGSCL